MAVRLLRRPFTGADYHRLAETGILLARRPSPGHYPAVRDQARWWFNKAHRGHACLELLEVLRTDGVAVPADLESAARRLDLHYVQSRYPNGLGGDPTRYYDTSLAEECLDQSGRMLKFAQDHLDGGQ